MRRLLAVWLSLLAAPMLAAETRLPSLPAPVVAAPIAGVVAAPQGPVAAVGAAAQGGPSAAGSLEIVAGALSAQDQRPQAEAARALDRTFDGSDVTRDFLSLHEDVKAGRAGPLPKAASDVTYLVVNGFLGNHIHDYFRAPLERLRALGLDARRIETHTEGRRQQGISRIEQAVRESDKPVVLIAHSRGGTLAHDWYRRASPELKAKVAKLVFMQSPLGGTSYIEMLLESGWFRFKARRLGPWVYGVNVIRGLNEITRATRAWVMRTLPAWAPGDLAKVLTVRTAIVPGSDRFYDADHKQMAARGEPDNDGRVGADNAKIPGAKDVFLRGVDHQQLILQAPDLRRRLEGYAPHPTIDAGDAMEAIVRLLLR